MTEKRNMETRPDTIGAGSPPDSDDYRIARRCNGCGRFLTDPTSVLIGLGPTCRGDK